MTEPRENLTRVVNLWIEKAEQDFQVALRLSKTIDHEVLDAICFHSQQCVEKYLKAYLLLNEIKFPKTHDLTELHALFPLESKATISSDDLAELNSYAVDSRYPGEWDTPTPEGISEALRIMNQIRIKIRQFLKR